MAIADFKSRQNCPPPHRDEARIENGRFDLLVTGNGTVSVFLDINDDRVYQLSEPDWFRTSSEVTPADFDAVKDFHLEIEYILGDVTRKVSLMFCRNPDAVDNLTTCRRERIDRGTTRSFSLDRAIDSTFKSWAVWFNESDMDPWPFDRGLPHFMGTLSKSPCAVDGDLTTCTLAFADLLKDGGVDGGDAGPADGGVDADSDVDTDAAASR